MKEKRKQESRTYTQRLTDQHQQEKLKEAEGISNLEGNV